MFKNCVIIIWNLLEKGCSSNFSYIESLAPDDANGIFRHMPAIFRDIMAWHLYMFPLTHFFPCLSVRSLRQIRLNSLTYSIWLDRYKFIIDSALTSSKDMHRLEYRFSYTLRFHLRKYMYIYIYIIYYRNFRVVGKLIWKKQQIHESSSVKTHFSDRSFKIYVRLLCKVFLFLFFVR